MPKNTLPSSKLSPLERTAALIVYYQNAYDVWSKIPGVNQEMLNNWLFLIDALRSHKLVFEIAPYTSEAE